MLSGEGETPIVHSIRALHRMILFVGALACVFSAGAQTFQPTTRMNFPQIGQTATLLRNGMVLIAGEWPEVYDPATGKFSMTSDPLDPRFNHSATLLTSGKVLIAGGNDTRGNYLSSSELYDPATRRFTATGSLIKPRRLHTATLLADGRVLIAGGLSRALTGGDHVEATSEIYDPATGTWTAGPPLTAARYRHTATALLDGRILIAGGGPGFESGSEFGALSSADVVSTLAPHSDAAPRRTRAGRRRGV